MVAAAHRPYVFWFCIIQMLIQITTATASPILYSPSNLSERGVIITNTSGTIQVFDDGTNAAISQGSATDGGGDGTSTSVPAIIWITFCFLFGAPLAGAGIRGWRLTTGAGIGLAAAVAVWTAIVNSMSSDGIADLLLTVIVLSFCFLGFILGLFEFARVCGIAALTLTGGVALGIRIVLLRAGLLISDSHLYGLNWAIIGIFGGATGMLLIWKQRIAILLACSSSGTFLSFLAVDLLIYKDDGMSRGLRFLFDRNKAHLADILGNGYSPPLVTRILLIVSLALVPVLAYMQDKLFKAPFNRRKAPDDTELSINFPTNQRSASTFMSDLWEGGTMKLKAISRFSV